MSKFDLVIFDMDGLMIDTERMILEIGLEVLKEYQYPADREFLISMTGISDPRMKPHFYKRFGDNFPFENYLTAVTKKRALWIEEKGVVVKPGLFELLDYIKEKNIKRIVATSSSRQTLETMFQLTGISDYISMAVCGDEVINGKPHPEVFLKAAEKASVEPHKALVLEDSENGLRAAYSAGMASIFIKDLVEPAKEVKDTIYKQCDTLKQVIQVLEE